MANFRLHYFSEVLRMNVGVNVIIPENTWGHSLADRPKGYRYPVLWLQSGGGFDYTDWQRYTALELYAAEAGIAVVCSGTYCSGYMDTKHGDFKYFTHRLSGDRSTYYLVFLNNFFFRPLFGGLVLCAFFRNGTQITMFQPWFLRVLLFLISERAAASPRRRGGGESRGWR